MSAVPVSRPWRRFLRFSVRGMIVLVMGLGLAWLVRMVRSARIQRDAVAAIKKASGWATYDWQMPPNGEVFGEPWAPSWLTDLVGVDTFGSITAVVLSERETDTAILAVARLHSVEELILRRSAITDGGLVHLKDLTNLSKLDLGRTHVTDAGLAHLKGLTNLSELDLYDTRITDVGLVHLVGLTKLSELRVRRTGVTDAGVKELQQSLPTLKVSR
jgi:internalin A